MPTLERIQKVIVSGMLGLGLSVMLAAPSVAQNEAYLKAMEERLTKAIEGVKKDLKKDLESQQHQIDGLNNRVDKIERRGHTSYPRPIHASTPRRVVHTHRYYYRYYWCPPWWY
jgi:hypothetical protein